MAQRGFPLLRHHQPGATGQATEQGGRFGQQVLGRTAGHRDLPLDRLAFIGRQFADLQQAIHEQAQTGMGRHATGAGVRGAEQAEIGEVGHGIADRGRGEGEIAAL